MAFRYYEDFHPGEVIGRGSHTISESAIIAFARDFDPQYFHTDPERAMQSAFGGLVASGWHTCAIFMRLLVDGLFRETASLASPGVDEIRWPRPVRPADTLTGRLTVLDAAPSQSRADRGRVKHLGELFNQRQELVMSLRAITILGRRPSGLGA
jgi:acyl dehydratase